MKNAFLILNPKAGQSRFPGLVLADIDKELYTHGIECDIAFTRDVGDGARLAAKAIDRGYDIIIAGGGDGTVNDVANGMVGSGAPLGILPIGTVNVLARDLGISLDLAAVIRTISHGRVRNIDLGCADGKYFTLMVGLGFDAEVISNVLQPVKDWIGASAYIFKGLETLAWYQATDITLIMPDQTYSSQAFLVIVANVSRYSFHLRVTPDASPEDGLLDICVFERPFTDRFGFMHQVADLFIDRHLEHDSVKSFRTPWVKIESEPEIMVQVDGDPFGMTPVDIRVIPGALSVIVPETI